MPSSPYPAAPVAAVLTVAEATSPEALSHVARLVQAYAAGLGTAVCFDNLDHELVNLGSVYAPPHNGVWLAWCGDEPAGCCAFKACPDTDHVNACEMKRLYVSPAFRGLGIGHALVEAVLQAARLSGYSCVLLDTLHEMEAARSLYVNMGFVEIPPYAPTPVAGAHHLKAML